MNFSDLPLRLKRDEDGVLVPIKGSTPTLSMDIEVIPMTYGQSRNYNSFGEPVMLWSDEDKMAVINNHVIFPEIEIENVEDMNENFDPWTIEDLVAGVFIYSGMARLFVADPNEEAEATDKPISA